MDDSADEAVPEAGAAAARPPGANVPAEAKRERGSRQEANSGLVLLKAVAAGSVRRTPPRLERLLSFGPHAAIAVCLFGFAWAAGSYFSGGHSPVDALKLVFARSWAPQASAERGELLRTVQKMAGDIRAVQASVDALRTAQSQAAKGAAALEGLSARLDALKAETTASLAAFAGKAERVQREPEARLSQIINRLDRMERQLAGPAAAGAIGAAPAQAAAAQKQAQIAVAPAKPRLETANGQEKPRLITNWIVRDAYDGIALVEGPRGAIEVAPGEAIPGAGTVKSIERRGAGWIVITSQGLVDSARGRFLP